MQAPSTNFPLIPEILRLICEELHSHKGTLASLAATCSAFKEPALDTLWFRLHGFYNLARCLNPEAWKEVVKDKKTILTIRRPVNSKWCHSMFQYSKHVKEFYFENFSDAKQVDISVYQTIQLILNGRKLLPNVRYLHCQHMQDSDPGFSFLSLFMGPHITRFAWGFPGKFSPQISIILMIHEHYPNLTEVFCRFDRFTDTQLEMNIAGVVSHVVYRWKKLESVSIPNINHTGLINLSKLPHLQSLELSCWNPPEDSFNSSSRKPFQGFAALKFLTIETDLSSCASFLETVECWRLNTLVILMRDGFSTEWEKLFKIIGDHCHHETLEIIDCEDEMTEGETISYEYIQPLLAFKNLQKLRIVASEANISDPTAAMQMARSWLKIKSLKIEGLPFLRSEETSALTLLDLLSFAEHCPDLEELSICLDATSPPAVEQYRPGNGIFQRKLTSLGVNDSPASDHGLIAAFLSSTFPSLRKISYMGTVDLDSDQEDEELQTEAWGKAEELLGVFASVFSVVSS